MSENFDNEAIDVFQLPQFENITLNKVSDKYINILHINMFIVFFIVLLLSIGYYIVSIFKEKLIFKFWPIIIVFIVFVSIYLFQFFYFKTRRFVFRNHDVIYKRGLLSETTTIVPFNKMQHIALNQGWISRIYGLADLEFYTAGGGSVDMSISGLKKEDAEKYQVYVLSFLNQNEDKDLDINLKTKDESAI